MKARRSPLGKDAGGPRRNSELSGMEAANPKRATLRLAAALGGVLMTLAFGVATVVVLAQRYGGAPVVAVSEAPIDVSAEPIASYHLPEGAVSPLGDDDLATAMATPPSFEPPAYEPVTPPTVPVTTPVAARTADYPITAPFPTTNVEGGATMIYNPAAFGPPEDDSIPGLPTMQPPPRVAARAAGGPAFPKTLDPNPGHWEGPPSFKSTTASTSIEAAAPPSGGAETSAINEPAKPVLKAIVPDTTPRELLELATADNEALLSYTASTKDLSRRLEPEVQAGFELGKSGAVYAARAKFIEVLRKVALAKDATEGSTRCATVLAEGLRKLDEADDFVPKGTALEAELDVAAIASSHGVRLTNEAGPVAPHEAIAQYSQHAAVCLAEAVADEPAGSMALYGLGKSYARLEAQGGDATAGRKSLVMYRAAVDAHSQNFLAANELGVRLAQDGRYEQASRVLQAAASQPGAIATVHANLAAIEDKLGREQAAVAAKQESEKLAQRERAAGEVSRRHGVEWVDPNAFRQSPPAGRAPSVAAATPAAAPVGSSNTRQVYAPASQQAPAPQRAQPSGWRGFVERAKRATGWSKEPAFQPQPTAPPAVASQPRVYR
ncbi:tetratricopeptide repeat protein [Botrimarina mediterranea]|uniref:tetratricopeptide repeat protein n=1 Tax=Botrimarina mediterranea TaxID=2528022 RepID=UPI0011A92A5E